MTVANLRKTVLLYGIIVVGFGIFQAVNAFFPVTPESARNKGYDWKKSTFIYKNISIEESWHDAKFKSELSFSDQAYNPKTRDNRQNLNLLDPRYVHFPKIFSLYYLFISALWVLVFYHIYKLVNSFYHRQEFHIKNPDNLKKIGKTIVLIGLTKYMGYMLIMLFLSLKTDLYISMSFDYDLVIDWIVLIGIGYLLIMLCNAFNKGITLEKEQTLTI